jgi:tetratricopeptide (TPR) repeat protein
MGDHLLAIGQFERALELRQAKLGPDHVGTLESRGNLAQADSSAGRIAEAIALDDVTVKLREAKLGPDHPATLGCRGNLAADYEAIGRWTDATALRRDFLGRRRRVEKPDSPLLGHDLAGLGENLLKQARWSEAESLLREALTIYEKARRDDWRRYNAMNELGGALMGQGRYAEAEPVVVPGYEGFKAREAKIPARHKPRLAEAAERVVRLYEEWGKPGPTAAWKVKLGLADLPVDVFAAP